MQEFRSSLASFRSFIHFYSTTRTHCGRHLPFREFIILAGTTTNSLLQKLPLKDFPAQIAAKFNVTKIEPWSEHFLSTEGAYLDELHNSATKSGVTFANVAADTDHSIYSADASVRQLASQFGKQWIDVAARLSSPSVRLNIANAANAKPELTQVADGLKPIADYAASKNVAVHLENDNPISEDPFFIASVVDRINSPWLHALPDFGNSFAVLSTAEVSAASTRCLLAPTLFRTSRTHYHPCRQSHPDRARGGLALA